MRHSPQSCAARPDASPHTAPILWADDHRRGPSGHFRTAVHTDGRVGGGHRGHIAHGAAKDGRGRRHRHVRAAPPAGAGRHRHRQVTGLPGASPAACPGQRTSRGDLTATIALQTQIVRKDLPQLVEALAPHLPRTPTFSLLKGRANYLCRHKMDGGYPADVDAGALFGEVSAEPSRTGGERLGEQVRRLRAWAEETDTGDRDSPTDAVSDRAWRQVSVTGSQCLAAPARWSSPASPSAAARSPARSIW